LSVPSAKYHRWDSNYWQKLTYILGDFCLLNQKDDPTIREKNKARINIAIILERKDISAKPIYHLS